MDCIESLSQRTRGSGVYPLGVHDRSCFRVTLYIPGWHDGCPNGKDSGRSMTTSRRPWQSCYAALACVLLVKGSSDEQVHNNTWRYEHPGLNCGRAASINIFTPRRGAHQAFRKNSQLDTAFFAVQARISCMCQWPSYCEESQLSQYAISSLRMRKKRFVAVIDFDAVMYP